MRPWVNLFIKRHKLWSKSQPNYLSGHKLGPHFEAKENNSCSIPKHYIPVAVLKDRRCWHIAPFERCVQLLIAGHILLRNIEEPQQNNSWLVWLAIDNPNCPKRWKTKDICCKLRILHGAWRMHLHLTIGPRHKARQEARANCSQLQDSNAPGSSGTGPCPWQVLALSSKTDCWKQRDCRNVECVTLNKWIRVSILPALVFSAVSGAKVHNIGGQMSTECWQKTPQNSTTKTSQHIGQNIQHHKYKTNSMQMYTMNKEHSVSSRRRTSGENDLIKSARIEQNCWFFCFAAQESCFGTTSQHKDCSASQRRLRSRLLPQASQTPLFSKPSRLTHAIQITKKRHQLTETIAKTSLKS